MQFAQRYLEAGYSVIPLPTRQKAPPPLGWNSYAKSAASLGQVKAWWAENPDANIGAATGAGTGVCVVDLDGPIAREWGRKNKLYSPMTVITGREDGGLQLWYRWPTKGTVRNSASKLAEGVDTRGEGGYGIMPPSIHPNGRMYALVGGIIPKDRLPELPILFLADSTTLTTRKPTLDVAGALEGLSNGNRNDTFTSLVGKLHRQRWLASDIRSLLLPHALRVQFDPNELEGIIRSVSRYAVPTAVTETKSESVGEFLQDRQEVKWICRPIIAEKSIGFVAGLPETLKTWLLLDLAVESARPSGTWLGLFPTKMQRVLFIDQERFKGETQRRFNALIAGKGLSHSELNQQLFIKCGTTIKLDQEVSFQAFRSELSELKPSLVIVDSFATFHGSPENDRMAIQLVLNRIKALRDEFGCTFVFINHESKMVFQHVDENKTPTAFDMLGSVGIVAAAEFCLTVRKLGEGLSQVHHTKSTLANASKSFTVSLNDVADGVVVKGTL